MNDSSEARYRDGGAPSEARLHGDLRAIVGDGIAFSVMVGIGESYVPAFALAAGLGEVTAGLVATLPMLAGALFQLVTPSACRRLGSHRRWVVLCAALQAASLVPLAAAAFSGSLPRWVLYAAVAAYWGFGMATSPAWNTWVGTLVPPYLRARFFAARTRWAQLAVLVGLLAGGALLQWSGGSLASFGALFVIAGLARLLSARFLARQSEPLPVPLGDTRISLPAFVAHGRASGHGRLLAYLLGFQLSVWIAAAYFTPYMLSALGLSYASYTVLTGAAFGARVLALPALGRIAERAGTRRLLQLGSIGIVPLPALWLVSDSFAWLLVLQLLSGVAWAAFELATLLAFFERIPVHSRTSVLSMFNLANALALTAGTLIGTAIFRAGGGQAFAAVLVLSSVARLLAFSQLRRVPELAAPSGQPAATRTLSVRPSVGGIERPILPTISEEDSPSGPGGAAS